MSKKACTTKACPCTDARKEFLSQSIFLAVSDSSTVFNSYNNTQYDLCHLINCFDSVLK